MQNGSPAKGTGVAYGRIGVLDVLSVGCGAGTNGLGGRSRPGEFGLGRCLCRLGLERRLEATWWWRDRGRRFAWKQVLDVVWWVALRRWRDEGIGTPKGGGAG